MEYIHFTRGKKHMSGYSVTVYGGKSGASNLVREYTLASGGPYCDCGYKKK